MFRANTHTHSQIQPIMVSLSLTIQERFHASHCRLSSSCLNGQHVFLFGNRWCSHLLIPTPSSSWSVSVCTFFPHLPWVSLWFWSLCLSPFYLATTLSVCCSAALLLSASLFYLLKRMSALYLGQSVFCFSRQCQ